MKRKLFTLLVALCVTTCLWANGTEIDGIYYTFSGTTASVTYTGYSPEVGSSSYTGAIVIPSSITYDGTTYSVTGVDYGAFHGCTGLTSIYIPNSVTSIDAAFWGCSGLTSINVNPSNTHYVSVDGVLFDYAKKTLIQYPRGKTSTEYTIPNSVTSISGSIFGGAFSGCTALTSITIPEGITNIYVCTFSGCTGLTSVTIPNSVTSIGEYAFSGCTGLASVTIPNSVTSIGGDAFSGCTGLASFIVESANAHFSTADGVLFNHAKDTLIQYPVGKTLTEYTIPNSVTRIGESAFDECKNLTSITIPNSIKSIGHSAFYSCTGLTKVNISDISTWCRISFENGDFYANPLYYAKHLYLNNAEVTNLIIPNNVTSIGRYAFYGCTGITSITIPNSIGSIGESAFNSCTGITSITSYAVTPPTMGYSVFYNVSKTIPLYVPNESIDTYKSVNQWKDFNVTGFVTTNVNNEDYGTISTSMAQRTDSCTLTAIPNYGYHFIRWIDGNTDNPRIVAATPMVAYTAEFAKNKYTITANAEYGEVTGAGIYNYLDTTSLSVIADYGYHFTQWSDGNTDSPRTVIVTKDSTFTAKFAKNLFTVTTTAEHGEVTKVGTPTYQDTIILNVAPDYGYHFTQWSDGNTDNPRSVIVIQDTAFTAEFAKNTYTISTSAEHGVVTGAGTYDYQEVVSLNVTADYGYHFAQWNDGNTDNPRTIIVAKDSIFTAEFAKNSYAITASAQYGVVTGIGTYAYLDSVELQVTNIDYRYHFIQWSDGNTDNPRSVLLTQDTIFTAEFAKNYKGTCGDNINWYYANGTLTITGAGDMYNYAIDSVPWILFRDSITSVAFSGDITSIGAYAFYGLTNRGFTKLVLPQTVKSIGAYAFANCTRLTSITLSTALLEIADYAFFGCTRVNDITCMASTSPDIYENTFNGISDDAYLYVPCDYKRSYTLDVNWKRFDVQCAGAEETTTTDLTVTPGTTDATFTWPTNTSADTYTLEIKKDGVVFCTLVFNANGQLTSITFAPSRNGANKATAATSTANGYRFTVTGLSEASHYTFNFDVKDASQKSVKTYTGEFNTQGGIATSIDEINEEVSVVKFIQNGKLYIRTSNGLFDATGRMVE